MGLNLQINFVGFLNSEVIPVCEKISEEKPLQNIDETNASFFGLQFSISGIPTNNQTNKKKAQKNTAKASERVQMFIFFIFFYTAMSILMGGCGS